MFVIIHVFLARVVFVHTPDAKVAYLLRKQKRKREKKVFARLNVVVVIRDVFFYQDVYRHVVDRFDLFFENEVAEQGPHAIEPLHLRPLCNQVRDASVEQARHVCVDDIIPDQFERLPLRVEIAAQQVGARVEDDACPHLRLSAEKVVEDGAVFLRLIRIQLHGMDTSALGLLGEVIAETLFAFHHLRDKLVALADEAEDGEVVRRVDLLVEESPGNVPRIVRVGPVVGDTMGIFDKSINQDIRNFQLVEPFSKPDNAVAELRRDDDPLAVCLLKTGN